MVHKVSHIKVTPEQKDLRGKILEEFLESVLSFNQIHTWDFVPGMSAKDAVAETHYVYEGEYEIRLQTTVHNIQPKYWEEFVWPRLLLYGKKWDCEMYLVVVESNLYFLRYYLEDKPFKIQIRPGVRIGNIVTTNQE